MNLKMKDSYSYKGRGSKKKVMEFSIPSKVMEYILSTKFKI